MVWVVRRKVDPGSSGWEWDDASACGVVVEVIGSGWTSQRSVG